MEEKIVIRKNAAVVPWDPFYHESIVYTDKDGVEHQIDGGPDFDHPDADGPVKIKVEEGPFDSTRNYAPELYEVASGADLNALWDRMKQDGQDITDRGFPYYPFSENSNSVVHTILDMEHIHQPPYNPLYPTPAFDLDLFHLNNGRRGGKHGTGSGWLPNFLKPILYAQIDPLVIDLTGNGFNLIGRADSEAYYNWKNADFAQNTSWIGSGSGLLALDSDSDGDISPDELFGSATQNGFEDLEQLDSNSDGKIDSSDTQFSSLLVWQDLNGDGISESGELSSLSSLGISNIGLSVTNLNHNINGNWVSEVATVSFAGGGTSKIGEVTFEYSDVYTNYTGSQTISTAAEALPQVAGLGTALDLRRAMSQDADLLTMVSDLQSISALDQTEFDESLESIIYQWMGASEVSPDSRGDVFDSRRLAALEAFSGRSFSSGGPINAWASAQGITLTKAWEAFFQGVKARILVQDASSGLSDKFHYNDAADIIEPLADIEVTVSSIADDAPSDVAEARVYWTNALIVLNAAIQDMGDFGTAVSDEMLAVLQSNVPAEFSIDVLKAVSAGNLTYVNSSDAPLDETSTVYGTENTDLIFVSSDNQTVNGLGGNDEIVIGIGLGTTTISSVHKHDVANGSDLNGTLFLRGIDADDVVITADRFGELVLSLNGAGDNVVLSGASDDALGIQTVVFDDGTTWSADDLIPVNATGTVGDDVLYGTGAADEFDGLGGDDYVAGYGGGDKFIFNSGYGALEILEYDIAGGINTVQFGPDIGPEDVVVTSDGVNIFLTVGATGDQIKLDKMLSNSDYGIQRVTFDNGTVWTKGDIFSKNATGTASNDVISGTSGSELIDGHGGYDVVNGQGGSDWFVFNSGYGRLRINQDSSATSQNTVFLGSDITPSTVKVSEIGYSGDVVLDIGAGGDEIILSRMALSQSYGLQSVTFSDGTTWTWQDVFNMATAGTAGDDSIYGSHSDNIFENGAGDDLFISNGGNDTLEFNIGDGADWFVPKYGNILDLGSASTGAMTVAFGGSISADDIAWHFDRTDTLTAQITGTADSVTIEHPWDFDTSVTFADGTVLSKEDLRDIKYTGTSSDDLMIGDGDVLLGDQGPDHFVGGAGDDQIFDPSGTAGDTYTFNLGDGRDIIYGDGTILFGSGIETTDITVENIHGAFLLRVGTGGNQILYYGPTSGSDPVVTFHDGTNWTRSDLVSAATVVAGTDDLLGGSHTNIWNVDLSAGDAWIDGIDARYGVIKLHNVDPADAKIVPLYYYADGLSGRFVLYANGHTLETLGIYNGNGSIEFDDGTIWTATDLAAMYNASHSGAIRPITSYSPDDGFQNAFVNGGSFSFSGIASTEVSFSRQRSDSFDGDDDVIIVDIKGDSPGRVVMRLTGSSVTTLSFTDGSVTTAQIEAQLIAQSATDGGDYIEGFSGADTLAGGKGDDLLVGGQGSDSYVWSPGDGYDYIHDQGGAGTDTLVLHSVDLGDVTIGMDPSDSDNAIVTIGNETITLQGQLFYSTILTNTEDVIEKIVFDDGTVWDQTEIGIRAHGGFGSTVTIAGTTGNDTLTGNGSNNVIDGGAGNDTIATGAGNDLILFGVGSGNDTLNEADAEQPNYGTDGIKLVDLNPSDVTFLSPGDGTPALKIVINTTGETLTISDNKGVQRFFFADGTIWDQTEAQAHTWTGSDSPTGGTYYGSIGSDQFLNGSGDDTFYGGGGSDSYHWSPGDGNDTIGEGSDIASTDKLYLHDIDPDDVILSGATGDPFSDLGTRVQIGGETINIEVEGLSPDDGVEQIVFDDGIIWDRSYILSHALVRGTAGLDELYDTIKDDFFDGGQGDDFFFSDKGGSDTYLYAAGDGSDFISDDGNSSSEVDILKFTDLDASDVRFGRSNADLLITTPDGAVIEIQDGLYLEVGGDPGFMGPYAGIEQIQFADGTTMSRTDIAQAVFGPTIEGGAGNDSLVGGSGDELIAGGSGNDTLDGHGGTDRLVGGVGSDTYIFGTGYGADTIQDTSHTGDTNKLQFVSGIDPSDIQVGYSDAGDVILSIGAGDQVKLTGMHNSDANSVQQIGFVDETTWNRSDLMAKIADGETLTGTATSENLYGSDGADTIDGGGGTDYVEGHGGGDTFIFNSGYGILTIKEKDLGAEPNNVLQLGPGITASDVSVLYQTSGSIILEIAGSSDRITLNGMYNDLSSGVQEVHFDDGTVWTRDYVISAAVLTETVITGTTGNDALSGFGFGRFDGLGGHDVENGGGNGDTFVYNAGYGYLEIREGDFQSAGNNILEFGTGIDPSDISLSGDGRGDVVLSIAGGGQVVLDGQDFGEGGISGVSFADGTHWNSDDLHVVDNNPTTGGDILIGSVAAESFDGLGAIGGDEPVPDYIVGFGGGDTFHFNAGYGELDISESDTGLSPNNVLSFGAGIDPNDVSVTTNDGGDIILTIADSNDVVVLYGMYTDDTRGVQSVQFSDTTTWSASAIRGMVPPNVITGTTGDDSLYGTAGPDDFDGLGGTDDYEQGGGGGDIFRFNSGYGELDIEEQDSSPSAHNVLLLGPGITTSDVIEVNPGDGSIVLNIGVGGDFVQLSGMAVDPTNGVQIVRFDDGTEWTADYLREHLPANAITGTTGDDNLIGSDGSDIFDGLGGNDIENGWGGSDTFIFNAGYGHLSISQWVPLSWDPHNVLQLGPGIDPGDVTKSLNSNGDIVLTIGTGGDEVTLQYQNYMDGDGVQTVVFDDATVWTADDLYTSSLSTSAGDDLVFGTSGSETIDALGASTYDYVQGHGGDDTFVFNTGYGELDIAQYNSSPTANSVLELGAGIDPSDVSIVQTEWNAVELDIGTSGDIVYLYDMLSDSTAGVQSITFDDGTVWSGTSVRVGATMGSGGADTLQGTSGAETFDGAGGTDTVTGGGGSDTYIFKSGYGDLTIDNSGGSNPHGTLELSSGFTDQDLWFLQSGNDLVMQTIGGSDSVTVSGWFGSNDAKLSAVSIDGGEQVDADLTSLISAMATFANDNPAFDAATATSMPTDTALQAVIASSWHG